MWRAFAKRNDCTLRVEYSKLRKTYAWPCPSSVPTVVSSVDTTFNGASIINIAWVTEDGRARHFNAFLNICFN